MCVREWEEILEDRFEILLVTVVFMASSQLLDGLESKELRMLLLAKKGNTPFQL